MAPLRETPASPQFPPDARNLSQCFGKVKTRLRIVYISTGPDADRFDEVGALSAMQLAMLASMVGEEPSHGHGRHEPGASRKISQYDHASHFPGDLPLQQLFPSGSSPSCDSFSIWSQYHAMVRWSRVKSLVKFGPPAVGCAVFSYVRSWRMQEILEEDPTKSARATFLGHENLNLNNPDGTARVVVSFPGIHGKGWNYLTAQRTSLRTSCVFLPDETSPGYGEHGHGSDPCVCHDLYGKKEDWGCRWFYLWKAKTLEAATARTGTRTSITNGIREETVEETGPELIVVTKKDGGLGNSQKGEIRFLQENNIPFTPINIGEFALAYQPTPLEDYLICATGYMCCFLVLAGYFLRLVFCSCSF
eukprot:Skav205173  [mRNA]  locus=scaffold1525:70265:76853:- [translate_table: standard]